MSAAATIAISSFTLARFPWLRAALSPHRLVLLETSFGKADAVAGWGRKPVALCARWIAARRNLPFWTLEDGFYRSVGLGKAGADSFSLILDRQGIYFDAFAPSSLDHLLQAEISDAARARARELRELIVARRLTKYNHLPDRPLRLDSPRGRRRIVLVDQVARDHSLRGSGADADTFATMWAQARALERNGEATVFAKPHPDVAAGYARGMLAVAIGAEQVRWIAPDAAAPALLDAVDEVWTASSQLGFEALLRGRRTICFGAPFYAGWGLTEDRASTAAVRTVLGHRGRFRLSLDQMVHAALIAYPIYFDPIRGVPTSPESALQRLAACRDG